MSTCLEARSIQKPATPAVVALQVCYPKPTDKSLYNGLVTQCQSLGLPFVAASELPQASLAASFDVIVDALFGFSFTGVPRPPFDSILQLLRHHSTGCMLASVDIPSGWDVEAGPTSDEAIQPDMLISLTAPKLGCKGFKV